MTSAQFRAREQMVWTWRDPMRGLRHTVTRYIYRASPVQQFIYSTGCGYFVSVDDVNAKTTANDAPTCLRCIVATPLGGVINVPE